MTFLFSEYILLFFYFAVAILLALICLFGSILFVSTQSYPEKLSPYECGFDPFDDARNEFDIKFYLVAILFLVFDIETLFLFPWAISLSKITFFGFWSIFDFIFELVVGFFYVWRIGALEWS